MRARNQATERHDEALQRWSVADDYLADPAVAPLRALVAALARRISGRRGGRPAAIRSRSERPSTSSLASTGALRTA
jgi:hypothetical protein